MPTILSVSALAAQAGYRDNAFASAVPDAVSVDVSFRRDCSDIGFLDARRREAGGALLRRSFSACRSRSPAAHSPVPSTGA
jgi:hypothetical protein